VCASSLPVAPSVPCRGGFLSSLDCGASSAAGPQLCWTGGGAESESESQSGSAERACPVVNRPYAHCGLLYPRPTARPIPSRPVPHCQD